MKIVSSFMNADHAYLDELLLEFLAEKYDFKVAVKKFKDFQKHILFHIELENDFLFPKFNEFTGLESKNGPTFIAMRDHEVIIKMIKKIEEAVILGNIKDILKNGKRLFNVFQKHKLREQKIHYPVGDFFVSIGEWQKALEKIYGDELEKLKKNFFNN